MTYLDVSVAHSTVPSADHTHNAASPDAAVNAAWDDKLRREYAPLPRNSAFRLLPVVCATNGTIGFKCEQAILTVVLAPSGPFFPTGLTPISMLVDESNLRAAPGGVGWCKAAGNYAPTLAPLAGALAEHRCQQVRPSSLL